MLVSEKVIHSIMLNAVIVDYIFAKLFFAKIVILFRDKNSF